MHTCFLLLLISKISLNVIYDWTLNFLTGNKIIYKYQPGFQVNCSAPFCLSYLTNKILNDFDKDLSTAMTMTFLANPNWLTDWMNEWMTEWIRYSNYSLLFSFSFYFSFAWLIQTDISVVPLWSLWVLRDLLFKDK